MFRKWFTTFALLSALALPGSASAKLRVAASINDLASIASSVGGDQVEVFSIARPVNDTHRVEVLPSYMVKVSRAQLYLKVGMGLDQWADAIIDGSRNTHLTIVDCSKDIQRLEVPTAQVSAQMGDVHPYGNPHYWLDPRNGAIIAGTIAEALASADPKHAADYRTRAETFAKQAEETWSRGKEAVAALPAKVMITYHRSWSYFANAFGIDIVGEAEPVPGIPPTGKHLAEIVKIAKERKVPLFLQEPYFSDDAGSFLAREAGVRVVVASTCCDSTAAGSYLEHFTQLFAEIGAAKS
jgi:zinc/manganese transport system substrate-binding protein